MMMMAKNASLRASVVALREVIDVLLDGITGGISVGGGDGPSYHREKKDREREGV
jgi:predicted RNA-binding Zn ribbon-like protein